MKGIYKRTKKHKKQAIKNLRGGMLGKHHSEETKKKLSISRVGKKFSNEHKRKLSKTHRGKVSGNRGKRGQIAWNKGLCGDKSHMYGKRNELASGWQGGKSFEQYTQGWTSVLKESIRERDNYICKVCGIHQDELGGWYKRLDCHHIDYNKKNLNPGNLISLCRSCHIKTNFNRDYWIEFFKEHYEQ